jgi:hypothetical protein
MTFITLPDGYLYWASTPTEGTYKFSVGTACDESFNPELTAEGFSRIEADPTFRFPAYSPHAPSEEPAHAFQSEIDSESYNPKDLV